MSSSQKNKRAVVLDASGNVPLREEDTVAVDLNDNSEPFVVPEDPRDVRIPRVQPNVLMAMVVSWLASLTRWANRTEYRLAELERFKNEQLEFDDDRPPEEQEQ